MERQNNINEIMEQLPANYENKCSETGAIKRFRVFGTAKKLMSYCLMYLCRNISLMEISLLAKLEGIQISDVGLMKKFAKCTEWYKWILNEMLPVSIVEYQKPKGLEKYKLTAIDASTVRSKGKVKKVFRLHYAINRPPRKLN
jgi:hypothetical protein